MIEKLLNKIRTIEDFPKPGVQYKDITTLLKDPKALTELNQHLVERYQSYDLDYVVGIESRGFIFGSMLAIALGVGFIPIRKEGKLPHHVHQQEYTLEYGEDILEIHKDAFYDSKRVVLVDDLLATGGTLAAAVSLIQKAGGDCVETCCLLELKALHGCELLAQPHYSVLSC